MKVSIVGLGLIGGSIAIDLQAKGFAIEIRGVDQNHDHISQAKSRGFCDTIVSFEEAIQNVDLVILATPVDAILKLLPKILDQIGSETTVTDMGSTKASMCELVKNHPKRRQYVACHPMAGTEHSGPLAALRGLFENRTTVICDSESSAPRDLRRLDEMNDVLGLRKVFMSSHEHDLHAAYVSHLSHISSFVLANTVLDKERDVRTIFDLAGGGFESTVRLAKSSPQMWTPIFDQNRKHILSALDDYMSQLEKFRDTLKAGESEKTRDLMVEANSIKRVLQTISIAREKK